MATREFPFGFLMGKDDRREIGPLALLSVSGGDDILPFRLSEPWPLLSWVGFLSKAVLTKMF